MIALPRRPVKFNCHRDPGGHTGNHTKEKSQPDCIPDTEYDRVRHCSREQPQRPVFSAQQIVSKIQRSKHIEARRRDAHAGQQVMIDGVREMHALIVEGKSLLLKSYFLCKALSLRLCFFS